MGVKPAGTKDESAFAARLGSRRADAASVVRLRSKESYVQIMGTKDVTAADASLHFERMQVRASYFSLSLGVKE